MKDFCFYMKRSTDYVQARNSGLISNDDDDIVDLGSLTLFLSLRLAFSSALSAQCISSEEGNKEEQTKHIYFENEKPQRKSKEWPTKLCIRRYNYGGIVTVIFPKYSKKKVYQKW